MSPSGLLLETLNSGGAAAESLLGRVVRNGLSQNGVGVRSMEFNVTPRGVNYSGFNKVEIAKVVRKSGKH